MKLFLFLLYLLLCDICYINAYRKNSKPTSPKRKSRKGKLKEWNSSWYRPSEKKGKRDRKLGKLTENIKQDSTCKCGVSPLDLRIVNGKETPINKYPWMAAIMYIDEDGNLSQFCGGAVISDRYILTAAHCIYPEDETYVRLGDHDYEKDGETKYALDIYVVKQWKHEGYKDCCEDKDIGLLYLDESVKFSKYKGTIVPVCLPTEHLKYYNLDVTVAGWGMHEYDGGDDAVLPQMFETQLKVLWMDECRNKYNYKAKDITHNMLCTYKEGTGDCQGDSGGPLFFLNPNRERVEQIGVVSWGHGCAYTDWPGVYVKVSKFLIWIAKNTKNSVYCSG